MKVLFLILIAISIASSSCHYAGEHDIGGWYVIDWIQGGYNLGSDANLHWCGCNCYVPGTNLLAPVCALKAVNVRFYTECLWTGDSSNGVLTLPQYLSQCLKVASPPVDPDPICTGGQVLVNNVCVCQYNQVFQNGQCVCPVTGQVADGQNCHCKFNQVVINGQCVCQVTGQVADGQNCHCKFNQVVKDGSCVCPATGQVTEGENCHCKFNQVVKDGSCVCPATGQVTEGENCHCKYGKIVKNNICVCPATGQTVKDGKCVCPEGQSVIGDQCAGCKDNFYYKQETKECIECDWFVLDWYQNGYNLGSDANLHWCNCNCYVPGTNLMHPVCTKGVINFWHECQWFCPGQPKTTYGVKTLQEFQNFCYNR